MRGHSLINGQDPLFILETERLILRRQQAGDVAILANLWADPEATRHLGVLAKAAGFNPYLKKRQKTLFPKHMTFGRLSRRKRVN